MMQTQTSMGFRYGTEITNQAGIYFDRNEVVLCNTTLNTVRDIANSQPAKY